MTSEHLENACEVALAPYEAREINGKVNRCSDVCGLRCGTCNASGALECAAIVRIEGECVGEKCYRGAIRPLASSTLEFADSGEAHASALRELFLG
jgi:hypothetical protein